jgi:hypothetical protein
MPLTHDFKETIQARAQLDPKFRWALRLFFLDPAVVFT